MTEIRNATEDDFRAVYEIAAATGDAGADVRHLHPELDLDIVGDIFAIPYLKFSPRLSFVLVSDNRIQGYCVGTGNTRAFEATLTSEWWPQVREKYEAPDPRKKARWGPGEHWRSQIHSAVNTPSELAALYPGHLHANLSEDARGTGLGAELVAVWLRAARKEGVSAAHVGVDPRNTRGFAFWQKQGFARLQGFDDGAQWMGRQL